MLIKKKCVRLGQLEEYPFPDVRAHDDFRPSTDFEQLQRRGGESDGRTKRLRRQARQHLQHQVHRRNSVQGARRKTLQAVVGRQHDEGAASKDL